MKVAIVQYPGSHGARDCEAFIRVHCADVEARLVWHQEESFDGFDLVIVPGGASFGDCLHPGRLAKASPISATLRKYCSDGRLAIGIGNGFQILCEIGALPGVLLENKYNEFVSGETHLAVERTESPLLQAVEAESIYRLPFQCRCGRYWADTRAVKEIEEEGRVALRYCDQDGDVDPKDPFNANLNSIAAVLNSKKTTIGMMVHPEYALDPLQPEAIEENLLLRMVRSVR